MGAILDTLEKLGGLAGIGAFIVIVVQAIRTRYEVITTKNKADAEIQVARKKAEDEARLAQAQVEKLKTETDVMLIGTMQRRLDTLTIRIGAIEKENEAKDAEIVCLKYRIDDLERLSEKKDVELKKRDDRIIELEKQTASQAEEITKLKSQVAELQKRKTGPLPFLAPKAEG